MANLFCSRCGNVVQERYSNNTFRDVVNHTMIAGKIVCSRHLPLLNGSVNRSVQSTPSSDNFEWYKTQLREMELKEDLRQQALRAQRKYRQ